MNAIHCRGCGQPISLARDGASADCVGCTLRLHDWQGFEPESAAVGLLAAQPLPVERPRLVSACRRTLNSTRAAMSTVFGRLSRPA